MASELSMNGRKKIETLQKEFTQKFPYLTLVFLDKERRAVDISKSLSEVRQAKGEDISIIASLKVNTLEKRFLENFGLVVEVAYQKSNKVVYTKDNVEKTLNELNKWCQENDCQPFEFKKSFTGNTLSSVQEQLFEAIKEYYPNAEAKKINKDNYLDIHIPEINKKRGTHLFFNTAKDGIKIGFYCRDEEFIEEVLSKSSNIEKYSQGIRILNNPLQNDVEEATKSALSFIEEITGEQKEKNEINNEEEEIDIDAILKEMGYEEDEEDEIDVEEGNKNNISGDNFIKINISGLGSEIFMGLIDNKEFQKFEEFYTTNNFTSTNKAWLAYIDKKGKGYWDYNETANLVGILLDELNIKVFDKNGEEIYNSNYYDIDIEIGDNNWRDYNINESKKRGVYIDKKSDKTLVVYKSNEYFSFDFVVPNTTKFEIEKLTIFYSCTDELGHGNDYGDYSNSLKYNEEVYAATEFGQNNLECEVKFISGKDKSEKEFVLEQEDEDIDIDAILEEMGYDDEEEEEEDEDDSTNELDEQNYQLVNALEIFDSETMAMAQMFPQFGITEVGTGSGSWKGNFYTYEYRTEWNEGYLENYDAISVKALIDLLKTKNINDFNQDDLGSLGVGTLRNGNTSYENFKWDEDVSKQDIKNAPEEEELCKGGDIQDSEYLWDSPERIEFVVTEDDKEDLNFILINKNVVIEESENDTESEEDEEEEENYDEEEEEENDEEEEEDEDEEEEDEEEEEEDEEEDEEEEEEDEEEEDEDEEEEDEDEEEEDEEEIDDTKVEFEDYTVTKYGFIDKKGNLVIPCIYDSVYNFDGGIARVQQNGEWFFIDKKGNSIFKNRDIETSSEAGLLKEKKNNLYGLIDINGNQILDFKYDEIDDFSEGFAKVEKNNKVGYINKKGIEIIACKYDSGNDFVNGFVNVTLDDKKMILTDIGEVISNNEYDEVYDFNEGLCKVGLENKYGFINQKGEVIVPLIYDEATDFSNGYSCVDYEGKKLLIDKFGKNSLKINYDEILPFSDGLARVSQKDKYGFIDINGIEVIKCKYDAAESFSNGLAEVELKSQKQLIDKTGKVLFNKDFDFISSFQEDFVMIQVDSQWGFIDSKANKLTEFIYEDADSFSNGLAAVKMDEKWGYINTLGKEVISFEYESASSFKEDLARVSQIQIIKREKFNGVVLTNDYPVNSYGDVQKLKDIIVKDFKQIRFISKNLQEDENALKELIFLNNKIFPYLPLDIKNRETIIKIAIEAGYYDESFIEYIDINNTELLEKIISKAPLYFKLIPESSKSINLSRLAITKCAEIEFEDLPKSIQSDLGFFEDLLVTISNNTFPSIDYDKIYVGLHYSESIHFGYVPLFCNDRDFILKYDLITDASDDISENREFCFEYHNKWNNSFERIIYAANPALADDLDFIKLGLSYDMANFGNLGDNYSNNKELLDFAVKNGKGRLSILDIPESLIYTAVRGGIIADIDLLTHIVENNNYEITRVPEVIRHNPEYAKPLIWAGRTKTNILYYAPKFIRKDRELIKALFKINPISLVFADSSILSDYSFMCDIIKDLPIIIKFCSKTLQRDKNFILEAVRNNGLVYKYIPEALQSDPKVYWAALKQNVDCFSDLPSSVQGIQSVLEYVSLKNGSLIDKCASKIKSKQIKFNAYLNSENNSFKSEFSISKSFNEGISDNELLSTLKVDPTQMIFVTEQFLSQDRQRLLEILKYSPYPLQFKSCRNILNQNELKIFIKENSWFFKYLDESEKSESSFIKEMLSINGLLIQYLSNEQRQDLELVKIALKQSTNACRFLSLEINWDEPEAKSIAIELLTQDPSQISYFIYLDDLNKKSNVEYFFFHAFALDVSVINLIDLTRVSTDYSTTPWFNSKVYGSHEMDQDELVLGMNQNGKFFDFDPIFNISTNVDIAVSHGRDFEWEGLFNDFDGIELIETAFKYFPNEETYKALKKKIGEKIESQEYVNPITITETPNLYKLISKEAQGLLDNAIAFIRAESELDYSEKFDQLPSSFKTNKDFLDSISDLEINFEILDAFFDNKILYDEHFITTYLIKNYHEYINLPENLQTNRNIALSYGTNYVETRFTYDTELELNEKFKKDKSLLIEISSQNLYNNFTIDGELLTDHKFLFEIIKLQPQLIQSISKDSLNSKLIIDVLKININAFDYLEPEEMLIPEVLNYIIENNPSKIQKLNYSYTIIELIGHLKGNTSLTKVINLIESDEIIKLISDFHAITTKVFNSDGSSVVSDIGTLYHVNGYCEFTLGYDNNCYLSEDVAGVIDYEVINEFLESDEFWSDYIWSESWHDYDSIYHSYGITEPATDLKLPNEEIVSVNLKYESPEYDKFKDCFKSSEMGDFVHIASSDEKSYSWEGWKRHKLEVGPGIFDVNRISVEFEGDIVSGYIYNYNDGRSDDFEEISDYSTSGKGFTGDLYFNNGKALISVDSDELKEALGSAGIEYDEHEKLKEFCEKFYRDKKE